jgi:hypothetical protein
MVNMLLLLAGFFIELRKEEKRKCGDATPSILPRSGALYR